MKHFKPDGPKKDDESRERFRTLFEDSHLALVIFDPESGRIADCNRAAAAIYGQPDVAAVRGLSPADLSAATQYDGRPSDLCLAEHIRQTLEHDEHQFEWRHQRPDGTLWDATVHAMSVQLGGRTLLQFALSDVTQQKAQEAGRQRLLQVLSLAEQGAHAGAWGWDIVHDRHYWSSALMRLFGLDLDGSKEDFEPWSAWRRALHLEDRAECEARFKASLETGQPFTHTYRIVLPSGEIRWIDALGAVMFDSSGAPQHYAGLCIDATARKAAEAELEQYRHHLEELVEMRTAEARRLERRAQLLLDSAANGLLGTDAQGCIVFANPAACEMLGYSADELQGREVHVLLHHHRPDGSPYPAEQCPNLKTMRYGEVTRNDEDVYWHRDGHPLPLITTCRPLLEDGRVTGTVLSFVDVSALRAAAQARVQALVAAEQLSELRQEFLRNISHELRTPLNGILGFAQIGRCNVTNPEKSANAFEKILHSGQRALDLVNDLLQFSKIATGQFVEPSAPFSPKRLMNSAVESVRSRANAKEVSLSANIASAVPQRCVAPHGQLLRVLRELLGNAVKFTPSGGRVELALDRVRESNEDCLVFQVTDTGPGIEASRLSEIFEPFHQLDGSMTRAFGGTGLGLALVERMVNAMGGRLRVESPSGGGCLFELRLPCQAASENREQAADEPLPGKPLAGLSLLVVEDEALDQNVILSLLPEYGAQVVLADSGEQALELCHHHGAFDLVLMDLKLPGIDGFQTATRLWTLSPDLPVLALTGQDTEENRQRCKALGFADFVVKPIEAITLVKTILTSIRKRDSTEPETPLPAEAGAGERSDGAGPGAVLAELLIHLRNDDFSCVSLLAQNESVLRQALGRDYPAIANAILDFSFEEALARLEAAGDARGLGETWWP